MRVELEGGCTRIYKFNITTVADPSSYVSIDKDFTFYCAGDAKTLKAVLSNTSVPVGLQWFKDGEALEGDTTATLSIQNDTVGTSTYIIRAEARNRCPLPRVTYDTLVLRTYALPKVYAGMDTLVDYNESIMLGTDATVSDGVLPYGYTWVKRGESTYQYRYHGSYGRFASSCQHHRLRTQGEGFCGLRG